MAFDEIHREINELVEEEHRLRREGAGTDEERARIRQVEEHLDQLWDLLRRRQALRDAGQDPSSAGERSVGEVEGYLQ